jgi:hypothetical protein
MKTSISKHVPTGPWIRRGLVIAGGAALYEFAAAVLPNGVPIGIAVLGIGLGMLNALGAACVSGSRLTFAGPSPRNRLK